MTTEYWDSAPRYVQQMGEISVSRCLVCGRLRSVVGLRAVKAADGELSIEILYACVEHPPKLLEERSAQGPEPDRLGKGNLGAGIQASRGKRPRKKKPGDL